jgi:hypothetical protein
MKQRDLLVGAIFVAMLLTTGTARATTYGLTCTNTSSDNLENTLLGLASYPWNAINGGPGGTQAVKPGDLVELTNICQGDVLISAATSGITITNRNHNTIGISNIDGINGQLAVKNAQLNADGLVLEAGVGTDSMTVGELADVYVNEGGSIRMNDVQLETAPLIGLYLLPGGSAQLIGGTAIENAGSLDTANKNDGIRAEQGSNVTLGSPSGGGGPQVEFNMGNGITLLSGSSLEVLGGSVVGFNGNCTQQCGNQIHASGASSVLITGNSTVEVNSSATTQPPLIAVMGASSITIDQTSFVGNVSAGEAPGALLVAAGSTALLNTALVVGTGLAKPVIEASTTASLVLGGGNTVCAGAYANPTCTVSAGGTAIEVDHSSSLIQQLAATVGYTSGGAEAITGKGTVLMQSSMELGQGPVSGAFGLVWSGALSVGQNSAIRMQSGVHVTGAVQISAASNGYFNCNNNGNSCSGAGAANEIDGTVQCLELLATPANPSVHVSNPQLIVNSSLAADSGVAVANLFGASSFATSTPATNTCLNF